MKIADLEYSQLCNRPIIINRLYQPHDRRLDHHKIHNIELIQIVCQDVEQIGL